MDDANFALPKSLKPIKKAEIKSPDDAPKKDTLGPGDGRAINMINDKSCETPNEIENSEKLCEKSIPPSVEPTEAFKTPLPLESTSTANTTLPASTKEPASKPPEPRTKSASENRKAKLEKKKKPEPEVVVLQYKEPKWSGPASYPYTLEVLKGGKILEEVDISESCFVTVGRLPSCDVPCLHPSISRHHAVFQHRATEDDKQGAVFLYDLGSSYGTTVNKVTISPRTYYMMKTGYVIKFGASSRLYIVKGPPEEAFEDEEEMTPVPEEPSVEDKINKLGILASEEAEIMLKMLKSRETDVDPEADNEAEGVNWGFREDAPEEEGGELKLDLTKMSRPADFKDPKKTFRGFFEREGVELEYVVTESGTGKNHQYICKVELPIDTPSPVFAEGTSTGKKRDAVLACAIHGCRLLDAYGVLRSSRRNEDIESRSQKLQKNDFYDSDEDTFLDRTGEVEHKRKRRMLRAGVQDSSQKSRSHDMLSEELRQVNEEIERIERTISESKAKKREGEDEEDALDAYMSSVSETTVTTGALREMKKKLHDLKLDRVKLEKLCEMSKPIALPEVKRLAAVPSNITTGKVGKVSVSKRTPSSTNTETKSVQPSKRIKIELSLKSEQSPTTSEQSNPNPEPSKSDSVSSKPEDSETLSSPQKITKITEFSSSNETHVDSSSPQKTIDPITQISNQDQEQISRSKTISDQGSVNKETAPKPSDKQKKAPKKKAKKTTPQNATLSENVQWDDDIHDENFVNWTPPVGQSGDGRTKLNEKFGY